MEFKGQNYRKPNLTPSSFLGKSRNFMVSGEDFPNNTNPLNGDHGGEIISPPTWRLCSLVIQSPRISLRFQQYHAGWIKILNEF